jgi:hypothetical protein
MSVDDSASTGIADLQKRLVELDRERADILAALEQLKRQVAASEVQHITTSQMAGGVASPAVLSNSEDSPVSLALQRSRRRFSAQVGKLKDW